MAGATRKRAYPDDVERNLREGADAARDGSNGAAAPAMLGARELCRRWVVRQPPPLLPLMALPLSALKDEQSKAAAMTRAALEFTPASNAAAGEMRKGVGKREGTNRIQQEQREPARSNRSRRTSRCQHLIARRADISHSGSRSDAVAAA